MPFQNQFLTRRKYSESNCQFLPSVECRYVLTLDELKDKKIFNFSQTKNAVLIMEEYKQKSSQRRIKQEKSEDLECFWESNFISFDFHQIENMEQNSQSYNSLSLQQQKMDKWTVDTLNI